MTSRRDILKAASIPFLGIPLLAVAAAENYDVIVVGSGAAGLAAAVRAAELGARVLVLEQNESVGGNTLISGGFLGVVDPVRQGALGIQDNYEKHFDDIWINGERLANPALVRTLVNKSAEMLEWIQKHGVRFQDKVVEIYGSHYPRCHVPVLPNGLSYIRGLSASAQRLQVTVLCSHKVVDIFPPSGTQKASVLVESKGSKKVFSASKGIILAAGGFGANNRMVSLFDKRLTDLPTNSTPGSTGQVLKAALQKRFLSVDLEQIQCLPGPTKEGQIRVRLHNDANRFIFVDSEGQRFIDETSRRDVLADKILGMPDKSCWCIIDDSTLKSYDLLVQRDAVRAVETGDAYKAKSIKTLAVYLGIDPLALEKTVEQYNSNLPSASRHPIKTAPFWASKIAMRIHYTMGGLKINEHAQCLSSNGPIKGMYAAGELTGGVHGKNRIGGNGLCDALCFGMIAAESALKFA